MVRVIASAVLFTVLMSVVSAATAQSNQFGNDDRLGDQAMPDQSPPGAPHGGTGDNVGAGNSALSGNTALSGNEGGQDAHASGNNSGRKTEATGGTIGEAHSQPKNSGGSSTAKATSGNSVLSGNAVGNGNSVGN